MQTSRVSKRTAIAVAVVGGALIGVWQMVGIAQRGSASSPVVGVWRVTEYTTTGPNGRKNTSPQPGVRIFTPHYYSTNFVTSDAPRPEVPTVDKRTDKDLVAAFGPFQAIAGSYEIRGDEILTKTTVAKNPATMRPGATINLTFRMEGKDTLWLTTRSNEDGPVANPMTFKLTRLE